MLPGLVRVSRAPILRISVDGRCVYASPALTTLLQCADRELLGEGWRCRISPFANRPFDLELVTRLAARGVPVRLRSPGGRKEIVSRINVVTDPSDPTIATGFVWRVQVVRVHRRPLTEEKTA